MISDTERREVARRLREMRGGWSSGECYYTVIRALGLPDTSREDGGEALYARLADLIEPPTQCPYYRSDRHYCSIHDVPAMDRDALLALADAMERKADDFDATVGDVPMVRAGYLTAYAERIRKALGEGEE